MKRIIGIIIVIICAISLFTVKNYGLGLVFAALAIFLIVMALKKKKRHTAPSPISSSPAPAPVHPSSVNPAPKPSASAPSPFQIRKANSETLKFKIAGVTFSGRQNTLRKIDEMEDERYAGCTYGIDQTEYQGSPAFRIYAQLSDDNMTEKDLGFVPKELIPKVLPIYDRIFDVEVYVYGGQDDKNYGAEATLYYDKPQ